MKKLLTLIIVFCSFNAIGQPVSSFGIALTPTYSYRFLCSENNDNIKNKYVYLDDLQIKGLLDSVEFSTFNYSVGLKYNLKFKRLVFTTGLYFLKTGEVEKRTYPTGHFEGSSSHPTVVFDGEKDFEFKYSYEYLTIPIKFNYLIVDKNIKVSTGLGINANILINKETKKPDNLDQLLFVPVLKNEYSQTKDFVTGIIGEFSIEKELSHGLTVFISPEFYLQMTPSLTIEDELKQYNYHYGLTFGIMKRI